MQPPIFIAGHDEPLGLARASLPATMAKAAAAQFARYRSEVRLFVAALAAGRLDEALVPEIETTFAELGRVVGLDFEQVRRGLGEPEKKKRGRPPRNDVLLMADLPDPFSWRDVAEIWGVHRREAFDRLNKIVEKNLA